ncbi:cyclase [Streptomyces subrutilus]|uniref:Cyclase n=1 Tax=Streptomyces subrutilus TaxID=36818 RepID=A0A5P2UDP4_9ACTN|nr:SRPBCC family protein [Streptomyces subrutilus]QEU77342.1 SRPBCC family protein [Streptomyces subrutilus]GGZ46688.1 cyclase [Streptomyces subrutilus]
MSHVEEHVEVNVPLRTAYNQWTQFEEFPSFMAGVERVEQRGDTLTHWVTNVNGVERTFDARITEQLPDRRVAWMTEGAGTRQGGLVTFEPVDATTTEIVVHVNWVPEGIAESTADKLGFVKRQVAGDLKRFKAFIETRGAETGAWRGEV